MSSRIFTTFSLVIVLLLAVSALSLAAIGRLVSVNSETTRRTVPAVRGAAGVREAMSTLVRLEARHVVLGDRQFAASWDEQAARVRVELERLRGYLSTRREETALREATAAFEQYQQLVAGERDLLAREQRREALRVMDGEARAQAERVELQLDTLMDAIHVAGLRAQADAARVESRTWAGILAAFGAAVLLVLVGSALLSVRLTRSLRAVSAATASLAGGRFDETVPVRGDDEIADLARSFNLMAARLRELDELKASFLATISHELRSPLTSVREAAHLLRDEIPGELNPKQARMVAIVEESTERLLRLVNQILELSRLRAGMLTLERRSLDMAAVVGRAVEELRPQAHEKGVTLEFRQAGELRAFVGDEDRLVQVVVNLGANAIRFTPRGGAVSISLADRPEAVELVVADTGVGIPAAALPQIFEWYQQAHRGRGGNGLGLAIVRGIAEVHGGRVLVESQEGRGSRFTVTLPRGTERA